MTREFILRLCERIFAAHCVLANRAERRTFVVTEEVNLMWGYQ